MHRTFAHQCSFMSISTLYTCEFVRIALLHSIHEPQFQRTTFNNSEATAFFTVDPFQTATSGTFNRRIYFKSSTRSLRKPSVKTDAGGHHPHLFPRFLVVIPPSGSTSLESR